MPCHNLMMQTKRICMLRVFSPKSIAHGEKPQGYDGNVCASRFGKENRIGWLSSAKAFVKECLFFCLSWKKSDKVFFFEKGLAVFLRSSYSLQGAVLSQCVVLLRTQSILLGLHWCIQHNIRNTGQALHIPASRAGLGTADSASTYTDIVLQRKLLNDSIVLFNRTK